MLDECGVCGGDNSSMYQIVRELTGGDAVEDNCGICDDDPANECSQDCAGVFQAETQESDRRVEHVRMILLTIVQDCAGGAKRRC